MSERDYDEDTDVNDANIVVDDEEIR